MSLSERLLAVLLKLEEDLLHTCRREVGDQQRCERLLSPLRLWRRRVQERAYETVMRDLGLAERI
ncbi:MAG: hypothetical protein GSR80_000110 [Desulfurococcales archaeon]|nr:hypothetical protein [Desulfurococcales archaeon]